MHARTRSPVADLGLTLELLVMGQMYGHPYIYKVLPRIKLVLSQICEIRLVKRNLLVFEILKLVASLRRFRVCKVNAHGLRYKSTRSFEKIPLPCQGDAGARSVLMRMRTPFFVRPQRPKRGHRNVKKRHHSLHLHYRKLLVAFLFDDLPSLSPFIS